MAPVEVMVACGSRRKTKGAATRSIAVMMVQIIWKLITFDPTEEIKSICFVLLQRYRGKIKLLSGIITMNRAERFSFFSMFSS